MESPMESMKTHLVVWLSGVVTGLILIERWRRLGDPSATTERVADVTDTKTAGQAPADKPKGLKLIVAGATAEAERARQLLGQVMPWAKNPAASLAGTVPPTTVSTGSFEDNDGSPPTH
jgi:hypothetical protein